MATKSSGRLEAVGAFLTGSRAYGAPRSIGAFNGPSDIDLVILMEPEEAAAFVKIGCTERPENDIPPLGGGGIRSNGEAGIHDESAKGNPDSYSVVFGQLNLIITTKREDFEAWRKATRELIHRHQETGRPIGRKEARAHIKHALGILEEEPPPYTPPAAMLAEWEESEG